MNDLQVEFKGVLKNHSKAVNCIRFRGAQGLHAQAQTPMACTHRRLVHRRAGPCCERVSTSLSVPQLCARKHLCIRCAGNTMLTAGDGGEMMIWAPPNEGQAIESWKVSQLLRCAASTQLHGLNKSTPAECWLARLSGNDSHTCVNRWLTRLLLRMYAEDTRTM